jgi:hypothetical protein
MRCLSCALYLLLCHASAAKKWQHEGCFYTGPRTAFLESLSGQAARFSSAEECGRLALGAGRTTFGLAFNGECWHCAECGDAFAKFGRVPHKQAHLCSSTADTFQVFRYRSSLCTRRRAVVFAGELRGDAVTWLRVHKQLVLHNDLDVVIDVWTAPEALEVLAKELFQPCEFYHEPYSLEWKREVLSKEPRFQLSAAQHLFALSDSEVFHQWDAAYRIWHSFTLLSRYDFDVVVRARLDSHFPRPVSLPLQVEPHSVYARLEWQGVTYEDGEREPLCPKMMQDVFACALHERCA